jgi:hypothetical protein
VPPTWRAIRSASTTRSPTGSARLAFSRSRHSSKRRVERTEQLGPAHGERAQRLRQRQTSADRRREVVDDLRPDLTQLDAAPAAPSAHQVQRRHRRERRERRSHDRHARRAEQRDEHDEEQARADRDELPYRHALDAGLRQQLIGAGAPRRSAALGPRPAR